MKDVLDFIVSQFWLGFLCGYLTLYGIRALKDFVTKKHAEEKIKLAVMKRIVAEEEKKTSVRIDAYSQAPH